jgi:hypothetical protein
MALINNIDTLKKTVKINKSGCYETIEPFLEDAERFYIEPYLGQALMSKLDGASIESAGNIGTLYKNIIRALGPFAYMLAVHEGSINFGDAGYTVLRTDSLAPASDAKIAAARESAEYRAWQNLEYLIVYLEENAESFPEWEQSRYRQLPLPRFFRTAVEFQSAGMVNLFNSRLAFEKLIDIIRRIEETEIRDLIPAEINESIGDPYTNVLSNAEELLVKVIRAYTASRVAAIHTSQTTRVQRTEVAHPEFRPVIRPLYEDIADTGNYYDKQAEYFKGKIIDELRDNFDVDVTGALNWNTQDKKLFCDIG